MTVATAAIGVVAAWPAAGDSSASAAPRAFSTAAAEARARFDDALAHRRSEAGASLPKLAGRHARGTDRDTETAGTDAAAAAVSLTPTLPFAALAAGTPGVRTTASAGAASEQRAAAAVAAAVSAARAVAAAASVPAAVTPTDGRWQLQIEGGALPPYRLDVRQTAGALEVALRFANAAEAPSGAQAERLRLRLAARGVALAGSAAPRARADEPLENER